MRKPTIPTATACALLLAACGADEPAVAEREDDPALAAALNEPIMVDADLVGQNRANSAAAIPSQDGSLPRVDNNPQAISAAREEALRLVGGPGRMNKAPEPREGAGEASPSVGCAAQARSTALWAARMPAPFPVYPRGAVQQAKGTDAAGCALRVVTFVTSVPLGEVIDFYFTRARAAGFSAERVLQDGDDVLSGAKGRATYAIRARRLSSGNTEVDLVTSGA